MNAKSLADALSVFLSGLNCAAAAHTGLLMDLSSGLYCLKMINAGLSELKKSIGLIKQIKEELTGTKK